MRLEAEDEDDPSTGVLVELFDVTVILKSGVHFTIRVQDSRVGTRAQDSSLETFEWMHATMGPQLRYINMDEIAAIISTPAESEAQPTHGVVSISPPP